jgi:hypothetical protein
MFFCLASALPEILFRILTCIMLVKRILPYLYKTAAANFQLLLITRELIYPGITRTYKNVDMWESEDLLKRSILRRISRKSGITDAL